MSGLTSILNVGVSGLNAATEGMQTISNNTSNVNTPGYNLETINQVAVPGTNLPAGGEGAGTNVTSIQRAFNQFVFQEIIGATATNQAAQTVLSNAQNLSAIFPVVSGGANGLSQAIDTFFSGVSTVAQNAASLPNRQIMLGDAQSAASLFNSVGGAVAANLASQNQQIGATVTQIDGLTSGIAALNRTITAQSGAGGTAPNNLLDQRDQMVQQLSQEIGVSVVQGSNGAVDIYANGGAALVNGGSSYQLTATSGSYLDGNTAVTYGPTGNDISASLSGGTLGGLISFRNQLETVASSVGALANNFAAAVNSQQAQGLDLNGNLGQAIFSLPAPATYTASSNTGTGSVAVAITSASALVPDNFVLTRTATGYQATDQATGQTTSLGSGSTLSYNGMTMTLSGTVNVGDSFEVQPTTNAAKSIAVTMTDPKLIAAASAYVATAGATTSGGGIVDGNVGNVQATIGGTVANRALPPGTAIVPAADFGQALSIKFTSPTTFNVLSSGGATVTSGSFSASGGATIALEYPGAAAGQALTVSLTGANAVAGDSYVLDPAGPGNNGNIGAMAGLNSSNLIASQSLGDYYAQLVSAIGNQGQEAQVASQSSQGVLTAAQNVQQSISGVNLDESAAMLVSYQQAYQASAQIIATVQSLFTNLIAAMQ
ncbi:MAG TPA: flagellar hook-associated protein FlgK [Stellaceae bacterium]